MTVTVQIVQKGKEETTTKKKKDAPAKYKAPKEEKSALLGQFTLDLMPFVIGVNFNCIGVYVLVCYVILSVCVSVRAYMCLRVCVCACAHACVHACVCVHASALGCLLILFKLW